MKLQVSFHEMIWYALKIIASEFSDIFNTFCIYLGSLTILTVTLNTLFFNTKSRTRSQEDDEKNKD